MFGPWFLPRRLIFHMLHFAGVWRIYPPSLETARWYVGLARKYRLEAEQLGFRLP